ncbi:LysR family transcriptional regulator [Microbaculum marinisediminis]|uniref:LysR family transcriptional regulator n=1 Tax=Microbaculum marinisediminis TaxID=2931392 RepID=A0AAW5R787_9HYPH|nr:LysR family transcriptional regulator [Microbaculum sp. A6E488]MCT8974533.1 LysR family transcriptional regulator [Microbaculum sp. A6E488]
MVSRNLDWNLIPSFLATAETGSLSAAARRLGISQPTVGRHVADLEQSLGVRLFDRTSSGLRITETALSLVEHAQDMRERAESLRRVAEGKAEAIEGTVRITASEMVAIYLLPDILAALHLAEPRIGIDVVASMTPDNLLLREADIALRMFRPEQNDVITRHVNDLEIGMFAHPDYLARRGTPTELSDLDRHSMIGFDRIDVIVRGFRRVGIEIDRDFFSYRCDSQSAGWEMAKAGFGIGFGPAYLGRRDGLVRLFPDIKHEVLELPIWLTAHRDLRHSRRIRFVYDFLAERLSALDL